MPLAEISFSLSTVAGVLPICRLFILHVFQFFSLSHTCAFIVHILHVDEIFIFVSWYFVKKLFAEMLP
jgi:hypothetical protein